MYADIAIVIGFYITPDVLIPEPATPSSPKPKEDLRSLKKLIWTSGPSLTLATRNPTTEKAVL